MLYYNLYCIIVYIILYYVASWPLAKHFGRSGDRLFTLPGAEHPRGGKPPQTLQQELVGWRPPRALGAFLTPGRGGEAAAGVRSPPRAPGGGRALRVVKPYVVWSPGLRPGGSPGAHLVPPTWPLARERLTELTEPQGWSSCGLLSTLPQMCASRARYFRNDLQVARRIQRARDLETLILSVTVHVVPCQGTSRRSNAAYVQEAKSSPLLSPRSGRVSPCPSGRIIGAWH